tara:strand:- start:27071 stop:28447 length:1377 start_codon:yes stop_codon:yes gene_type:complete
VKLRKRWAFILFAFLALGATYFTLDILLQIRIAEVLLDKVNSSDRSPSNASLEESIRKYLPFNEKLSDYFRLLGISKNGIGNASLNSGHINYFKGRSNLNPCFNRVAAEYFSLIKKYDEDVGIYPKIGDVSLLQGRPAIIDRLGQNERKHLKPGYAWELAVKMSQGDKHLALSLVSSCGHDDELRTFNPSVRCPDRTSSLYVPGSLGKEFTLDMDVTNYVIATQAPNLGGKAIPAKYYHTIASAFTACMAIKEGIPAWMIKRAQIYAARTYRSKRLCDRFSALIDSKPSVSIGQISSSEIVEFSREIEKQSLDDQEVSIKKFFFQRNASVDTRQNSGRVLINQMSYKGAIADYNSRFLFVQNFPDFVNCNPSSPAELLTLLRYRSKLSQLSSSNCPRVWNHDRCSEAVEKLRTWIADYDWSEASQAVGVDFAAENCPKSKGSIPLDANSCAAEKALNH